MLIKKLLDLNFENADFGSHLQPARVEALTSKSTGNGGSNDRDMIMARRIRRRSRLSRRERFNSGGWSVLAW
jgi:hypothetical protein